MMTRIERSELSVPGSNAEMIAKALRSGADVVMIDLEDSVPPERKREARRNVIDALREGDWGEKPPAYRVNAVETEFFYRDLVEVVEAAGDRLALIVVPKVDGPGDLAAADALLGSIERALGLEVGGIHLEAQIESARGLVEVERTAGASGRLESLIFGPGDYAASLHMPAEAIGVREAWDEWYEGDRFHYPLSRLLVAARAAGKRAIDGPNANFRDLEAFRASCVRARALGYDGKWCIHPAQIPIANEVFAPTEEEVARARAIVTAYDEATARGQGAISLENTMVDMASIRMAERTLEMARRAGRG